MILQQHKHKHQANSTLIYIHDEKQLKCMAHVNLTIT